MTTKPTFQEAALAGLREQAAQLAEYGDEGARETHHCPVAEQLALIVSDLALVVMRQAAELRECRLQLGLEIPEPLEGANK